jgi:lipid A 4'-phosphatase
MSYLKRRRSRIILGCFAISTLLLMTVPAIDIGVSRFFFHQGSFSRHWLPALMHAGMGWYLGLSMTAVVGIYAWNRCFKRQVFGIDGKRVLFLVLVLAIGAGLIVNGVLKEGFGRARPRDIAAFNGVKSYTPPFIITNQCSKNCSFSSGEGAGGFFALALAMALSRRRAALALAAAFGTLVSLCRVATGGHFFSDVVVSFFVMLIVADVLYFYLVTRREPAPEFARLRPQPAPTTPV